MASRRPAAAPDVLGRLRITASTVASTLGRAGVRTVTAGNRLREGVRVTGSHPTVSVSIDLDDDAHARTLAHACAQALRDAGYTVLTLMHRADLADGLAHSLTSLEVIRLAPGHTTDDWPARDVHLAALRIPQLASGAVVPDEPYLAVLDAAPAAPPTMAEAALLSTYIDYLAETRMDYGRHKRRYSRPYDTDPHLYTEVLRKRGTDDWTLRSTGWTTGATPQGHTATLHEVLDRRNPGLGWGQFRQREESAYE